MRATGQKLVKICTLTHAAKLVVRIDSITEPCGTPEIKVVSFDETRLMTTLQ